MTYTEAIQQHSKISTIKALHVDLETGLFEILHLNELEPKSKNNLLSEWTKKYVDGRHISEEFKEEFLKITDIYYLKTLYSNKKQFVINFEYKRSMLENNDYKWSILSIIPSTEENHILIFVHYVEDIYLYNIG